MEFLDLSRFRGQPWSEVFKHLDPASLTNAPPKRELNSRVTKLPREDMGLYGICPLNDRFVAVVCSTCGAIVKPQALQRHVEMRHSTDSESLLLPPPPQVPVKKNKTANVKMKSKDVVPAALIHSSENIVPSFQPTVVVKQIEMTSTANSKNFPSSKLPSLLTSLEPDISYSNMSNRKSPNINVDRKAHKVKDSDHELNKHTSMNEDSKTSRSTTSRSHLVSAKRNVIARHKNINIFNSENTSSKEQIAASKLRLTAPKALSLPDISDSGANTFQSSQSTNHDASPSTAVSPMEISPASPTVRTHVTASDSIVGPTSNVIGTSVRCPASTSTSTSIPIDYKANSAPSDNIITVPFVSQTRLTTISAINMSTSTISANESDGSGSTSVSGSSAGSGKVVTLQNSPQLVRVLPVTSSPIYTVKLTNNPVIILNSKETAPASAASVEQSTVSNVPFIVKVGSNVSDCTNEQRDVQVPILMQMPPLQGELANVTVYSRFPKPIVLSTFSAKRVGGALVFSSNSSRKLDYIRNQFKSVLTRRARRLNATSPLKCAPPPASPTTLYAPKPVNGSSTYRFSKATRPVPPNAQQTSLLGHRPNILRTTVQRPAKDQQVSKMLTASLKRPPQLATLDCKHILLKSNTNNINVNGIIGKMIVHPHEVTELGDASNTNHLTLDKAVPMNIK